MDQELLKRRAFELDSILAVHEKTVPDAALLRSAIGNLIKESEEGLVTKPLTTRPLPGELLFVEGHLGSLVDLSGAFGEFATEITGGPSPSLQKLRQRMGYDPLTGDKLTT